MDVCKAYREHRVVESGTCQPQNCQLLQRKIVEKCPIPELNVKIFYGKNGQIVRQGIDNMIYVYTYAYIHIYRYI